MTQARDKSPRVLIVEDDEVSRATLAMLLRHLNYAVRTASTVSEAFGQLEQCTHLLLDLGLHDGFGTELAERVRRRGLSIRLAVMTALDPHSSVVEEIRRFEPDLILRKPLQIGRVLEWLEASTVGGRGGGADAASAQ